MIDLFMFNWLAPLRRKAMGRVMTSAILPVRLAGMAIVRVRGHTGQCQPTAGRRRLRVLAGEVIG